MSDTTTNGWGGAGIPPVARGLIQVDRYMHHVRYEAEGSVLARSGVTWGGYLVLSAAAHCDGIGYRELAVTSRVSPGTCRGLSTRCAGTVC